MVAFVAAMAIAQRQRARLQRRQAMLVARAHEEERAWVAGELHDDILQRIAVSRQEIELLWTSSELRTPSALEQRLRGINAELVDLAAAVRGIAARIHPTVVDHVGLQASLRGLVDELGRDGRIEIVLNCDLGASRGLEREVARAAYRIVQEALRNAIRHSGSAQVRVTVRPAQEDLLVRIEDDGRGFDPDAVLPRSLGMASLLERATGVGGRATINSIPARGTTVVARLPWPSPAV